MQKKSDTEILWQCGDFRVGVLPRGGAITRLDWNRPDGQGYVPLLRPADKKAILSCNPSALGCFPLVPFANRLAHSQFEFDGRTVTVPANRAPDPHAIHGFGLYADWQVMKRDATRLRLEHRYDESPNGFDYVAWQEITPEGDGLRIEIGVSHLAARPMPYGIGLHPWFYATEDAEICFSALGSFRNDDGKLPVAPVVIDLGRDFSDPKLARRQRGLDAHYHGWTGIAEIIWPENGVRLVIGADETLRNLQVYLPPSGDAICLEPVSHVPNVQNRVDFKDYGDVRVLQQGDSLSGAMTLRPSLVAV
ncbi:aldose 1-epimerase [Thalassospira sp.]|uniref:aldose 1-epimerase n=1 Tax=Thalassospira sp. TaxID=1912094 RepID=UPI0027354F1D|nr:aldose 1-epimerase [Thalassospira sp.]MDP2698264.1 aldose 1-epimerase [Thalassospira sp.]